MCYIDVYIIYMCTYLAVAEAGAEMGYSWPNLYRSTGLLVLLPC